MASTEVLQSPTSRGSTAAASTPATAPTPPTPATPAAGTETGTPAKPALPPGGFQPGGKAAPFSSSVGLPPFTPNNGAQASQPVADYQPTFGNQSYVKNGQDQNLVGLAKAAAAKLPELAGNSQFAANLASGNLSPQDVKSLQGALEAHGYSVGNTGVDGKYGPKTHAALQALMSGAPPAAQTPQETKPSTTAAPANTTDGPKPAEVPKSPTDSPGADPNKLAANLNNKYKGVHHQCFKYAWTVTQQSGNKGINSASQDRSAKGQPASNLDALVKEGKIKPGDVIYTNNRPGADPTSTKMQYGPHWMVYMGNNKFADQYGVKTGAQMARTSSWNGPGKIDTIYHTT